MNGAPSPTAPAVGSPELRLPEVLRGPLLEHLAELRRHYLRRGWAGRVGFGTRPAVLAIDLALFWTRPDTQMGSQVDGVVTATCTVLKAARAVGVPIFFSTYDFDPADPPSPHAKKLALSLRPGDEHLLQLDPRLERRPKEKLFRKKYASCFKSTNLHEMLTGLGIDTLIVTGVSTSHCVYATCRDGTNSFRIIVPREAVGERCEIMHEVNLLDIDLDLGDVMPMADVVAYLERLPMKRS
jgi:nicotinamidase-related amidase